MAGKKQVVPAVDTREAAKHTARVVTNSPFAHAAVMTTIAKPLFGETDLTDFRPA